MILTIHPDARPFVWSGPVIGQDSAELGIEVMPWACHQLRSVFADHRMIATLGALEVVAAPGAEYALPAIHERLGQFVHDLGNSIPDCWMGAKHAIQNLATMQHEPKTDAITGAFTGTVLCIASGPSNAQHLAQIRELQHQCVIVCADSMWKGLRAAGIDPHFVCVLERDPLLASLVPPDPTSRAILVVPAVAYPETIKGWDGKRIWWWQTYSDLYRWLAPDIKQHPTGRSAGTMAVALSVLLGSPRVYLIGHDLCRSDSGSSHSTSVDDLAVINHATASLKREPLHDEMVIDGKRSCLFWNLARGDIEALAAENPGILRRLGQDGLYIPGVMHDDALTVVNPQSLTFPASLPIAPSRAPVELKSWIRDDIDWWKIYSPRIQSASERPDMESINEATRLIDPAVWGHPNLVGLYKYVLGPAFRGASLRGQLRSKQPYAHRDAFRILLRTIPATLDMMERDS